MKMTLFAVTIEPEYEEQTATTLAQCKTLDTFDYEIGASSSFCDHYCAALSKNVDSKLERLCMYHGYGRERDGLDLTGDQGTVSGVDAAIEARFAIC